MTTPPLAQALDLAPHPEGGWYRRTWTSPETITLPDGRQRPTATLIHFLLAAGEASAWHRVASTEVWLAHTAKITIQIGGAAEGPEPDGESQHLDPDAHTQIVVPPDTWQRTLPATHDALASCLVSPGFDFEDFELAHPQTGQPQ